MWYTYLQITQMRNVVSHVFLLNSCATHEVRFSDVIMSAMASQITGVIIVYSTVCSGADRRKHKKLRVTGLCEGNPPATGEFPSQNASNSENVGLGGIFAYFNILAVFLLPHTVSIQNPKNFHQHTLSFGNFPLSINQLFYALKTHLFFLIKARLSTTKLFIYFLQYLYTSKFLSIHQSIMAGVNTSLRARGHAGCRVDFHPTSLPRSPVNPLPQSNLDHY